MKAEDINKFFLHKITELIEDEFGVELFISTLLFHPKHAHIEFYGQHSLWIVDEEEETKREFSEQKQTIIKQTETVYIFSNSYSNLLEIDSVGLLFEKMYNQPSQQKKEILEASVPETRNRASSDFFMLGLKVANYQ